MTLERVLIAYLLVFIVIQAVFAAFPGLDLAFSSLFINEAGRFGWAEGMAPMINLVVRRFGELITFLLFAGLLYGFIIGKFPNEDLRLLAYPLLCVALACGALVNLLLKSHIGRARPDTIAEFGGTAHFTPPWQVVEECARNCSFTSGEASLAAGLAIPAVVILWPHLTRTRNRLLVVLVAVAYVTFTSILRIGLGRHFLSDTLFSILFSAGAAIVLYPVLRVGRARQHLPIIAPRTAARKPTERRSIL